MCSNAFWQSFYPLKLGSFSLCFINWYEMFLRSLRAYDRKVTIPQNYLESVTDFYHFILIIASYISLNNVYDDLQSFKMNVRPGHGK